MCSQKNDKRRAIHSPKVQFEALSPKRSAYGLVGLRCSRLPAQLLLPPCQKWSPFAPAVPFYSALDRRVPAFSHGFLAGFIL